MLQLRSIIKVADNSGARKVQMLGVPGRGNLKIAKIGMVISVSVMETDPYAAIKKGDKAYALIIRTRKETRRKDGTYIRFDDNACVMLTARDSKDPSGSRLFGPCAREIKQLGYNKIASLATEIY